MLSPQRTSFLWGKSDKMVAKGEVLAVLAKMAGLVAQVAHMEVEEEYLVV